MGSRSAVSSHEPGPRVYVGKSGESLRRLATIITHQERPRLAGRTLPRLTFGVALEPVVRDRLPLAGIVDVRAPLRPNAVARIEEPQADAPYVAGVRILAPERTAADGAEALRPTVARRVLAHELLAGEKAERAGRYPRLCGG